jgi:hypothetical protein
MRPDASDIDEAVYSAVSGHGTAIGDAGCPRSRDIRVFKRQLVRLCAALPSDLMIDELADLLDRADA